MNTLKKPILYVLFILPFSAWGQGKIMTPEVYNEWNNIRSTTISNNGAYVAYTLNKEAGDAILKVYEASSQNTFSFPRGESPRFSADGKHLMFKISPAYEIVRRKKLDGAKDDDLPTDTLGIYHLANKKLTKIEDMVSYDLPSKWGHHIVVKQKTHGRKKERHFLILNLINHSADTLWNAENHTFAEAKEGLMLESGGRDSILEAGLYSYNFSSNKMEGFFQQEGKYYQMAYSENGDKFAFVADFDTTDNKIKPIELYLAADNKNVQLIMDDKSPYLPQGLQVSPHRKPSWSDDGSLMYFGISPLPLIGDTSKLDNEKPGVEVWTTDDARLYTTQEVRLSSDLKQNYLMRYNIKGSQITQLESEVIEEVLLPRYGHSDIIAGVNESPYFKSMTWEGRGYGDLYRIDLLNGETDLIKKKVDGNIRLSPAGKYAYWFDRGTGQYNTVNLQTQKIVNTSQGISVSLADELNDRPQSASPYGVVGWTHNDAELLIYDRYDIWKIDPTGNTKAMNLTDGRKKKTTYRYVRLDREEDFLNLEKGLTLRHFDEKDKSSGYTHLNKDGKLKTLVEGPYRYASRVWKAAQADKVVFTKESFRAFPDLYISGSTFSNSKKISNANPQQKEYRWGEGQLYAWKNEKGEEMTGLVFYPDGFDKNKKYPLLVNFYERSSNGLHNHRAPFAGRSTISYSYYLNKGYVIFNPDIPYDIGYPGRSAHETVMSGVDDLISKGYIDASKMGLQGHSWGGYQIAHMLTKTGRFACAEAGAPVVNMTSAYGGIRWGSGMSRMFQYERTQSRIGATLFENPQLYLENSPLFETQNVTTPVLILHNDGDGAVPWYQGIEYYMALRRLDKKGWMLNYNGEPHWPVKWPNRLDFQTRMEQFFAHYLLDENMPDWMANGISEVEKGKKLGYEKTIRP